MPVLNADTSIVDYLKSVGQDSSFGARTTLATQAGIKGYTGSADQNTSLLSWAKSNIKAPGTPAPAPVVSSPVSTPPSSQGAGTGAVPSNPSQVQNQNQALSYVNGNQANDAASYAVSSGSGEPPVRSSVKTYDQILADIKTALGTSAPATAVAPEKPNYEQSYKDLRTSYGVDSLETSLTDLNNQAKTLQDQLQAFKNQERGKAVAENVITGRISQEQQTVQEQLDAVNRSISTATNQLNTKYNVINTIMKYKADDYNTAKDNYDSQFTQNLQLINLAKGISDSEKTDAERVQDDARANAQIVINTMTARGLTYNQLPVDEKTTLTKLGVQSGLGANFFSNVLSVSAGKEILTTITSSDQTTATIVYKDGTTKSISTGLPAKVTASDKPTSDEQKVYYKNSMATELKKVVGTDGYISPEDWAKARRAWSTNTPYSGADFDANFRDYVNPQHQSPPELPPVSHCI